MNRLGLLLLAFSITVACQQGPTDSLRIVAHDYLDGWADFYPSRALSAGLTEAAPRLENFDQNRVEGWLAFNQQALARLQVLANSSTLADEIDRQLLEGQINRELYQRGEAQIHRTDPQTYSELINHALTAVLVRSNLTAEMKLEAALHRLGGLESLSATAMTQLTDGRPSATAASIRDIRSTAAFIEGNLVSALGVGDDNPRREALLTSSVQTALALNELADWLDSDLALGLGDAYGEDLYTRKLALAYGAHLSPEILEQIAMAEIETVRALMDDLARENWASEPSTDFNTAIEPIMAKMESNRASNQSEFLQEFLDLIDRSRIFLEENDLIDLPEHETLFTALSPSHFAGAAVGGVYSAGPFDPEAETLFYLPTVPDTAPEVVKDGFYRSFNSHFNTMIITHEIYPGHYLQLKAAASNPSRIRSLFAGDDFTEGWASFVEQMTLDAGWDDDQPLTRMAHLRKRLENAVRAYVSVQVHCRGWSEDQLSVFAVETGLLPPQFAENLWHRALLSPIQLPSYFIGFRVFDDAYRKEQTRLGESFSTKAFNNAVITSGGIPMEMVAEYLETELGRQ
ncbi:MAG: DUF885 domain-containing protein [Candidatus Aminicenantes bacterium]|nr:MAG: DUF885 domain-containing protein [Candidatus Aminicenantes bacterium]